MACPLPNLERVTSILHSGSEIVQVKANGRSAATARLSSKQPDRMPLPKEVGFTVSDHYGPRKHSSIGEPRRHNSALAWVRKARQQRASPKDNSQYPSKIWGVVSMHNSGAIRNGKTPELRMRGLIRRFQP